MSDADWQNVDRDALRRQADLGDAASMHNLGVVSYYEGDATTAVEWYLRAARRGFVPSTYNLGLALGLVGRDDEVEGWMVAAAVAGNGDGDAMFNLVLRYTGRNLPDDAAYWRERSRAIGFDLDASTMGVPPDVAERFGRDGLPT